MSIGMWVRVWLMLCCVGGSAWSVDDAAVVEEGQVVTASADLALPEAAYPALQLHLQGISFARPLPWPYYLEEYEIHDGRVMVRGRIAQPGQYTIPLGTFRWQGTASLLPAFSYAVTPLRLPTPSASDLQLPFPEKALFPRAHNVQAERDLLAQNQSQGLRTVYRQMVWRRILIILMFLLVCVPIAVQWRRWWRMRTKPLPSVPPITPRMVFQEVKQLQQQGAVPWPKLVYVLNLMTSRATPSLTSYELAKYFTSVGENGLAQASSMIEEFGYRPGGEQHFAQTVHIVEQELAEKKLL